MRRLALASLCLLPALASAGGIKPSKATEAELATCMRDPDAALREACAEAIGERGLGGMADVLLEASEKDENARVREAALDALLDIASPLLAQAAALMVARDALPANRAHALAVIERHLGDSAAPSVIKAMQDQEPSIRRKAIIIVGKRGFSAGEPWLVEQGVNDAEPAVVVEVWEALVRLGNPDLRPRVHEALASGPEAVRKSIARVLREKVTPADRDALIGALDDACPNVARDAAKALVELGDTSVAPILREKAATATDEAVRKDLEKCALELGG